ncbi:hypothetical protein BKD09_19150 [Bradyrhizobium japonicum]|uniref:Transcriptional regulator n=1 Tax=Bradyrhizobium japonicum TaxID=375 RepID=A0A1L3FAW7_BRAJP|nr:hypothetical protein BKD09_19150 [Bradyrhizobium japonicum]
MIPTKTQPQLIAELMAESRAWTSSQLTDGGVERKALARAVEAGIVVQFARGIYCPPMIPDGMGYAAISLVNPGGVLCMQSTAVIHGLSDENPQVIWYATDRNKTRGTPTSPNREPMRLMFWSDAAMAAGVETMKFAGVDVLVTSPARTVIDMLRLSSKAGHGEQPMRALRDFIYAAGNTAELWSNAEALGCRDQMVAVLRLADEIRDNLPSPRSL